MIAPRVAPIALTTLFAVLSLVAPRQATPCVIAVEPFAITGEPASDVTAPEPPRMVDVEVRRGHGARPLGNGGAVATSCDDIGWLAIQLDAPTDATTQFDEVGFVIAVEGVLPANFRLPDSPLAAPQGVFRLHWIDGATDEQEPFAFEITLTAVDRAGNRSEPSTPLLVSHPGRTEDGVVGAEAGCLAVRQSVLVAVPDNVAAAEMAWFNCRRTILWGR